MKSIEVRKSDIEQDTIKLKSKKVHNNANNGIFIMKGQLVIHVVLTLWLIVDFIFRKLNENESIIDYFMAYDTSECVGAYDQMYDSYLFLHAYCSIIMFIEAKYEDSSHDENLTGSFTKILGILIIPLYMGIVLENAGENLKLKKWCVASSYQELEEFLYYSSVFMAMIVVAYSMIS